MKKKKNGRKIVISALLTKDEITYLDRKINTKTEGHQSRSALLRTLVRKSMEENIL